MSRAQRLTFLAIAVVIAVVAVIVLSSSGGDDEETASSTAATATPTATATPEPDADEAATPEPTPEPTPKPKPPPPLIGPGKVTELKFKEGEQVVFRVRADGPEEIHVHGYDVVEEVGTEPVRVSFPASLTGIWEIELHGTGEQIAELRVDPK
jgi:type IV secretory pathway VirB10-like protein